MFILQIDEQSEEFTVKRGKEGVKSWELDWSSPNRKNIFPIHFLLQLFFRKSDARKKLFSFRFLMMISNCESKRGEYGERWKNWGEIEYFLEQRLHVSSHTTWGWKLWWNNKDEICDIKYLNLYPFYLPRGIKGSRARCASLTLHSFEYVLFL